MWNLKSSFVRACSRSLLFSGLLCSVFFSHAVLAVSSEPIELYKQHKELLVVAEQKTKEGLYLEALDLYQNARTQFQQIKEQFPQWGSMILVDIQLTRTEERIKDLQELLKKVNHFQVTYPASDKTGVTAHDDEFVKESRLGDMLLTRQEYQRALFHYKKALQIKPDAADVRLNQAIALFKGKKTDEAEQFLKQLIQEHPEFAAAQFNLADMYYTMGHLEDAVAHYEKAIEIDADDLRSRVNLGVILVKQGQYNQALDQFLHVVGKDDSSTDGHYNLGVIYSDYLFDRDKAIFHYSKYLEIYPAAPDRSEIQEWIAELQKGAAVSSDFGMKG